MRNVEISTITEAFLATLADDTTPRFRLLITQLARHLHAFARETELTHAEWRRALEFLMEAGRITTDERNEFVLISDVLGLSSLVDMTHSAPGGTPSSVLGPFHLLGAPALPYGGDLKADLAGDTIVVSGVVSNVLGEPVPNVTLEIWQTAPNGLYSNQDPAMDSMALRCQARTRSDGAYLFSTVRPAPYSVPTDGPVGDLLRGMGRHAWRPAHFHFIAEAKGYRTLVTEVFPRDDPYIDTDAVFGVREDLLIEFVRQDSLEALPAGLAIAEKIKAPFYSVQFDIVLAV